MTTQGGSGAEVSLWLRGLREQAGLTQEDLAARSGLSVRSIRNLESGRTRWPHPRSVRLMIGALGLPETAGDELIVRMRADRHDAETVADELAPDQLLSDLREPLGREPDSVSGGVHPIPRQLPAGVAHFVGRPAELKILDGLLEQALGRDGTGRAVVISVIGGMGGIGKTALAVHWAHSVADRFPDGQLYANLRGFDPAGTLAAPGEVIRAFLDALQVPAGRIPLGPAEQAGLYRSMLAGRRMLIVLDNARDTAQVRPLLPGAPGCLVVVTSRSQLAGLAAAEGARLVNLDTLTGDEAAELMARRLGPDRVTGEPEAATELAGLCGGLPLALAITAARAASRPGFRLTALAAGLRDEHSRLDALDAGEDTASIRAVFSWSYQNLNAAAAGLFRLLGLHPGPDISVPATASLAGLDLTQTRGLLNQLAGACLVTEHAPGRYTLHDLLRTYAAEQACTFDDAARRRAAKRRLLDHYLNTAAAADQRLYPQRDPISLERPPPGVTPEGCTGYGQAMAWFDAEHTVLLSAVTLAAREGFDAHAWQLPWALGTFLDRRAHWHDYEAAQRTAVAAARHLGDTAAQAHSCRGLGHACAMLNSHTDAQDQFEQALRLYGELGDQVGQARAHNDIAWSYGSQGRHQEALEHNQQALPLARAAGHRAVEAHALNSLGWHSAHLGNYQHAVASCQHALELERDLGDRHDQACTWDSLGYAHAHLGDHTQAITCYSHALSLYHELGNRYLQARTLARLGDTYYTAGQPQAARDARQQALAILDNLRHPDATQVRTTLRHPHTTVDFG
jgi:tetratricopeptide (TPR) repeat protein/transcriptional regulator with XRE-family HTH domain